VQKPGGYLGLERNIVIKSWGSAAVRVLLAFPDEYGIGMSHQGTRILYHIANSRPDALAERTFAPWPDMAAAMRAAGVPLYGLESYHPARAFDVVGITLQTELNYVNVPYLLDLAGIPRFARDRGEGDDLVVTTNVRQSDGPTPGAKTILAALGVPEEQIPLVPILREATILEAARRVAVA
jgi:hypothetical protein